MSLEINVWICDWRVFDSPMTAKTYARRTFKRSGKVLAIEEGLAQLKSDLYPHRYGKGHPRFPIEDWKYHIVNDNTQLSYADWVDARLEETMCDLHQKSREI